MFKRITREFELPKTKSLITEKDIGYQVVDMKIKKLGQGKQLESCVTLLRDAPKSTHHILNIVITF